MCIYYLLFASSFFGFVLRNNSSRLSFFINFSIHNAAPSHKACLKEKEVQRGKNQRWGWTFSRTFKSDCQAEINCCCNWTKGFRGMAISYLLKFPLVSGFSHQMIWIIVYTHNWLAAFRIIQGDLCQIWKQDALILKIPLKDHEKLHDTKILMNIVVLKMIYLINLYFDVNVADCHEGL